MAKKLKQESVASIKEHQVEAAKPKRKKKADATEETVQAPSPIDEVPAEVIAKPARKRTKSAEVARPEEAAAPVTEKTATPSLDVAMAMERVVITRYPDTYTVCGAPVQIRSMNDACEMLLNSSFMRPILIDMIYRELRKGTVFQNVKQITTGWRGREDGVVSEYRVAKSDEVLDMASNYVIPAAREPRAIEVDHADTLADYAVGHAANAVKKGRSASKAERRESERAVIAPKPVKSRKPRASANGEAATQYKVVRADSYDKLPNQAKVLVDLLASDRVWNNASIEVVLTDRSALLNTKQPPMKIWKFYLKRLVSEGFISELGS